MFRGCDRKGLALLLLIPFTGVTLAVNSVAAQTGRSGSGRTAGENRTVDDLPTQDRQAESVTSELNAEERKQQLRKSALAGLLVLSLICAVFLILIIFVALWARRIRRLTRQPMPPPRPDDPLWYLRKGRPADGQKSADSITDRLPSDEF